MVSPEAPEEHRSAVRGERNPFVGMRPFPLENGDRLTRREFERRYAARPDIKKAELIEGVVHMPSPVRFAGHGEPHSLLDDLPGVRPITICFDLQGKYCRARCGRRCRLRGS